jgi:dimethylhistidine N-methyltransferase
MLIEVDPPGGGDPHEELLRGLRAPKAWIHPKYFYDSLGSLLFEAICQVPEYYLPRAEREILDAHGREIAAAVGAGCTLIDLGAGNCEKAERLFDLLKPAQYVAIDIAREFLGRSLERLQQRHPRLEIVGVCQDFAHGLMLPPEVRAERRLFFYPGSSIGNFAPEEAREFVYRIQVLCGEDGRLLLGVDLLKEWSTLETAYNDPLGVTAAFNRNILNHVNRIAGSDFDVRDWTHVARFNAAESRVEMHLEAATQVSVRLPDGPRTFRAGETIHTENSYKLSATSPLAMLGQAGTVWRDSHNYFATALLFGQ